MARKLKRCKVAANPYKANPRTRYAMDRSIKATNRARNARRALEDAIAEFEVAIRAEQTEHERFERICERERAAGRLVP